ncbi:MAG: hypothetical protein JRN06_03685 [Nitrososphaerota archaeon]|nr:hypothetical protein [Nitrososphaerota archaeon]MDG7023041.1 hypothetical protein [Nitrososphaerota archaeon]
MRFIDLAVAALIGSSAITGIVAWSPKAGDVGAQQLGAQVRLRDRLVGFLQRDGTIGFLESPAACQLISDASNSTFRLYATMGPTSCGTPPGLSSPSVAISLRLGKSEVVLVAWSSG